MVQQIYIVDDSKELIDDVLDRFKGESSFEFDNISSNNIHAAIISIPALFIINEDGINVNVKDIIEEIRKSEDNFITPIIVVSSNKDEKHRIDVLKGLVEYYIVKPINNDYFFYTIKNIIRLMYINRTVSPLTGLPGNVQIQAELKKRLKKKEKFAVLYFDLDNFKAYNDIYGFINGDHIIKFTADVIFKNVHKYGNKHDFIGHIGGDDFVAIVAPENMKALCKDVIAEFDAEVKKYFTDEDIERGFLESVNRKGNVEQFPLTSISIGAISNENRQFYNVLEIGEVGAQVKGKAKMIMGSSYYIDKRKE